jgi:hypothetical protein
MPSETDANSGRERPANMAPSTPASRLVNFLYAATVLLSAWLLFQVQPMVAKRILPWFGGGSSIWTTAMLFFQAALFAGYLYAHLTTSWLSPRRQAVVHALVLAAAAALVLVIRVVPADSWKPADNAYPLPRILALLAVCVGLPYFTLAATAPLVQVWFSRANPGVPPYRLYAASNLGSLAALLSYPFVVEPSLGLSQQGFIWTTLFLVFAALCASIALRTPSGLTMEAPDDTLPTHLEPSPESLDDQRSPSKLHRALWFALPACACLSLLAVTTHLCLDVASIPLLWIAPMAIYLVSFILTFDSDRWYRRDVWLPALGVSSFAALTCWVQGAKIPFAWQAGIHLTLLLSIGMICHGEVVRLRPRAQQLTAFYLSISAGGVIGGLLAALVAPLVLNDYDELAIAVVAAWVLSLLVLVTDPTSRFYDGRAFRPLAVMVLLLVGLVVAMGLHLARKRDGVVAMTRNFYGTLKVREVSRQSPEWSYYSLYSGRISHGSQFRAVDKRRFAIQYYVPHSGVGDLLLHTTPPREVGVVGLGAGGLAVYAEPGDHFLFYEINPQVIDLAERYFTYLPDARQRGARISVIEGDGRLSLERDPRQKFDILILDAFTSDSIPPHLLSLEAVEMYLERLKQPDGVLAFNISNNYVDVNLVLKAIVKRFDLDSRLVEAMDEDLGGISFWALLARKDSKFSKSSVGTTIEELMKDRPEVVWTDDHNALLPILKH